MIWDLTEFFKNKKECLREMENLTNIYDKLILLRKSDMNDINNLLSFIDACDKCDEYRYRFNVYIMLLETADYHNTELNTIKTKFNYINDKIKNVCLKIIDNIDILSYKNDPFYIVYKDFIDNYQEISQDETDIYSNAINTLLSDIDANNINPTTFKHTFIELLNIYFKNLKNSISTSLVEDLLIDHDELTKSDFERITKTMKENSSINNDFLYNFFNHKQKNIHISYEEAKDKIRQSFLPFGNEYLNILNETLANNTIDYKIRKFKSKENLTFFIKEHHAFANINYNNDVESVLTLAHEIGHMLEHNIKYIRNTKTGSACELYSLTNEMLVGRTLLRNANTLDEKIHISMQLAHLYYINLFDTICTTDFVLRLNREIDKKNYIDLKRMNYLNNKMIKDYNLINTNNIWMNNCLLDGLDTISYFYGIVGAVNVCNSIENKTFNKKDYLTILKGEHSGEFDSFKKLGFNPIADDSIKITLSSYKSLIENTKDLIHEKELRKKR